MVRGGSRVCELLCLYSCDILSSAKGCMRARVWLWLDFFLCFLLSCTPVASPFVSTRSWCDLLNSHWLQFVFQSLTGFFLAFVFSSFCNCTVLSAKYSWVLASSALRDYIVDLSLSICLLCDSTVQHGQYEESSALLNFSKWYLVTPAQRRCIHFWDTLPQKRHLQY